MEGTRGQSTGPEAMDFCRVVHLGLASNLQFSGVYSLSNISHFILNYD